MSLVYVLVTSGGLTILVVLWLLARRRKAARRPDPSSDVYPLW